MDSSKRESNIELAQDLVVIGLPLATSPQRAMQDIPAHWQRFMSGDTRARLAPRDGRIYAVYCDYEADFRRAYTMVLGFEVEAGSEVPAGLRRVRIPRGAYAAFAVEGDPAVVVNATWAHVNGPWQGQARRRYLADFERYAEGGAPSWVNVEVVIGLA